MRPPSNSMPSKRAPKRTSPPHAIICSRMVSTTFMSLSVPNVRLAFPKNLFRGARLRENMQHVAATGFLMFVVSLPSENVPAPPSPNCTFDSGFKAPPSLKELTEVMRASTSSPRSSDGRRARLRKSPCREQACGAHAPPRWDGRHLKPFANAIALIGDMALDLDFRFVRLPAKASSISWSATSKTNDAVKWTSFFRRASTESFENFHEVISA